MFTLPAHFVANLRIAWLPLPPPRSSLSGFPEMLSLRVPWDVVSQAWSPKVFSLNKTLTAFSLQLIFKLTRWPKDWSFSFSISLSMNIQGWFPLGWIGFIPCCPRDSQEPSPAPQFESTHCCPDHLRTTGPGLNALAQPSQLSQRHPN